MTQHETLLVLSPRSPLMVAAAPPVRCRHGRQKVLIPECDLTGRRVDRPSSLPVRSHSGIDTYCQPFKNLLFSNLVILQAKFHVVSTVNLKSAPFPAALVSTINATFFAYFGRDGNINGVHHG